eukprot:1154683-Pelagomonas_calceolata.AAC.2
MEAVARATGERAAAAEALAGGRAESIGVLHAELSRLREKLRVEILAGGCAGRKHQHAEHGTERKVSGIMILQQVEGEGISWQAESTGALNAGLSRRGKSEWLPYLRVHA